MDGEKVEDKAVAPLVDLDKLSTMFEERLKDGLKVFAQEQQAQQDQRAQDSQVAEAQRVANEKAQQDAFGQVIAPYLAPVAQGLKFQVDDTRDYVQFYTEHPDAVGRRQEIEQKFVELAKAGRAIPRDDIRTWMEGRDKLTKDREVATQAALQASTIASGVSQRDGLASKNPLEMTKDEMIAFLGQSTF
jgi:hypothetical protein